MAFFDLFRPKWRHPDANVRRTAVEKMTNRGRLAKIASEDKDGHVRAAATKRVTDQALLAKIAMEDKDQLVRVAAAEWVTPQALLAKIATEGKDPLVRIAAAKRVTDQALLAKIAVEDEDPWVRAAAAKRATDQALLAKIATGPAKQSALAAQLGGKASDLPSGAGTAGRKATAYREQVNSGMTPAQMAKLSQILGPRAPRAVREFVKENPQASDFGESMLTAAYKGRLDVVRALLAKGVSAGALDMRHGVTALMMASQEGHLDVVKTLIDKGADSRDQTTQGVTALMQAAQNGHLEVVRTLIEKGHADVNAKTTDGMTALKLASGYSEVVALLRKWGAKE